MTTSYLTRPEGRIAFELSGAPESAPESGPESGSESRTETGPDTTRPLVVCLPGMGELRSSYRFLAPLLVEAGYRVAVLDLRGHGDSDATFSAYDDEALAADALALIEELGGPAIIVGNSMGAGAATLAAGEHPAAVSGVVLIGPFVRNPDSRLGVLLFRALMLRPWGPAAFLSYYPKWTPGARPDDFDEHTEQVRENLRRPGHWHAFQQTTRTTHAPAEERLDQVRAPAAVVMGAADVDWKDPVAEARWIGEQLRIPADDVVIVPEIGHYPQVQAPQVVAQAVASVHARRDRA